MKNLLKIKKFVLTNFTLSKFLAAITTALVVATLKYYISGNFHLEYCDFLNNIAVALLGWTIHTGVLGLLTDYLGLNGLDFNLNQFIYGFETMKAGDVPSSEDLKPKYYNAMESDGEESPFKGMDKGKGVDKELHPNYDRSRGIRASPPIPESNTSDRAGPPKAESNTLEKIEEKYKFDLNLLLNPPVPVEPPMVT